MPNCPNCSRKFVTSRGLSFHYTRCNNQRNRTFFNISVTKQPTQTIKELIPNNIQESIDYDGNLHINEDNSTISTSDQKISFSKFSKKQLELIEQQDFFLKQNAGTRHLWTNEELAQLELMQILDKHNCHNSAFRDIIHWHSHYSTLKRSDINASYNRINEHPSIGREKFLNHIIKKQNMEQMKPKLRKVFVDSINAIDVTVFEFKQQLLSLLRDTSLMHQSNLVLDEPGARPNMQSREISEIKDGAWYQSAYEHYERLYGKDDSRLICGVILTVDKTHTDWKGKLCLEPVQFTLSIFNKELRKRNSNAWRCLGYINDLESHEITKMYSEEEVVTINEIENIYEERDQVHIKLEMV